MASTYLLQYKGRPLIRAIESQVLELRLDRRYPLQISCVFIAYLIAGKLGQATTNIRSSNLGPVWPAYGIALAAILICGYRIWPGIAAGAFLVAFFSPVPHLAALGQAAGATIAAITGAFLLYRIADFDSSLSRLSDALSLIVLGGFGSAVVSASIGVSVLYLTHVHAYSGLGKAWLIYWLGDATGVLLVAPLMLRFSDVTKQRDPARIAELAALLFCVGVTSLLIFSDLRFIPIKLHLMAFAVLPFIIWAAIRFGLGVTALSTLIVAGISTIDTALGSGPFASSTTFVNAVLLDLFFGVLSVSGLSVAALIAEREQVISKQAAMESQLRANDILLENEERLRLAAQAGKMYTYDWQAATDGVALSEEFTNMLGCNDGRTCFTRKQFLARVHPDDRAKFTDAIDELTPENPRFQISYGIMRSDGDVMWVETHGRAFFDPHGKILRLIAMVADISQRKQAEEVLAGMSKKLIEAQEQERARIGRELHDDINQRLALLAVELQQVQQNPVELQSRVQELRKMTSEISNDVQALSHELHSSKLEYLGVVAGIKSWCKEFGERQKIEIDFKSDVSKVLPIDIGLSLFRVLQEATHNAIKHSDVKRIVVELREESGEIHLVVSDDGKGFDVEAAMQGKGLGLISMRERVRLVKGNILIQSKPMAGTTIRVRVPLEVRPRRSESRATGATGASDV